MKVISKGFSKRFAQALAHQLGGAVGVARQGGIIDGNRAVALVAIATHRVVRTGEDHAVHTGQRGGVIDVGQGVKVGAKEFLPTGALAGVGRQVNHRVSAMEALGPLVVKPGKGRRR